MQRSAGLLPRALTSAGQVVAAGCPGRQVLRGFVFAEALFAPGQLRVPAALLWHGAVRALKVPGGMDVPGLVWHPRAARIRFV